MVRFTSEHIKPKTLMTAIYGTSNRKVKKEEVIQEGWRKGRVIKMTFA